ncbi:MAG TPA: helix-turn-helix domain-containing protein [Myxococcales bacterium]|nr:helix-turn-helix domain-containing protein [Myxococcales bacterium]
MDQGKKECILTAAIRAFTRFGFKKASVDEIAREAGVAKGTVYLAADSKEDLFFQALHREVREWVGENSKLIDPRRPADEVLRDLAWATLSQVERKPLVWALLSGEDERLLPRWEGRLDELRTLCTRNVVEVLELGIKQGIFRRDLEVAATAELLLEMQIVTLVYRSRGGPDREQRLAGLARAGFDLVFRGLRSEPGLAQAVAREIAASPAHP